MMNDDRFRLDQAPATEAEWRDAVDGVLKGRPFDKVLVNETRGGLDIQPLYEPTASTSIVPADAQRIAYGWDIRQRHGVGDLDACRAAVLDDLEHGVTSIELESPAATWTIDSLRMALTGVLLDIAPVVLAPHANLGSARALLALLDEQGDAETSRSWLGLDPIGEFSRAGSVGDLEGVAALAVEAAERHPHVVACTVDTTRYVDAGADEVQELTWMLATGIAVLRALEAAGMPVERAAATIGFRVSADGDQFLTIARLRAARSLWASALAVCGVTGQPSRFQAVTTPAMFSRRDAEVNMLRATSAVFGAGVGGADAVTVLPFDGSNSNLARRNARNIQHLLIAESGLNRFVDPGAGSGFVESLTERLVDAAWRGVQTLEAEGGMVVALESGAIEAAIDTAWETRLSRLARRQEPLTGVSEFPAVAAPVNGFEYTDGFPLRRPAAPFEVLRDAADRAGSPVVHLAALGSLADHTARSTWITNFLAVGGLGVDSGELDGARSPIEAAATFEDAGATVAVICSSDAVYAERAAATATALKDAGAVFVALAGHPGELRAELEAAGVDAFFHVGVDVLAALRDLHERLDIVPSTGPGSDS